MRPIHLPTLAHRTNRAHCANREQAAIIGYLEVEYRVLRTRLEAKGTRFTDAGRRHLAAKAVYALRAKPFGGSPTC